MRARVCHARVLIELIDAGLAGTCPDHASLPPDQRANWVKGLDTALRKFEIPKIVDPYARALRTLARYAQECAQHGATHYAHRMNSELTDPTDPDVNERDLVMYLSYFPKAFEKEEKEAEERRKKEAEEAAKRKAAEEEAARKKAEEDARKAAEAEAARKKKEEEDRLKREADEAARKKKAVTTCYL